jgi:SIR2-like protein
VLAETDYLDRLSFESPLDIRFRADALAKTILFIGYSLSDLNIRFLLHRLWKTWRSSGYERDRPQSFLFMLRSNPVDKAVLEQWGITVLTEPHSQPETALQSFLEELVNDLEEAAR